MALTVDPINKRIILDSTTISATEIYSRVTDWQSQDDNLKWGMVLRQVGSDDLGSGLAIPPYYFLQGAWRIRPMESNHTLIISGNLFVEGGGVPVVPTISNYNVSTQYTVPVQAQAFSTTGGGTSYTPEQIAQAVWDKMVVDHNLTGSFGNFMQSKLLSVAKFLGLK